MSRPYRKFRIFAEHFETGERKKIEVLTDSIETVHLKLGLEGFVVYKYYPINGQYVVDDDWSKHPKAMLKIKAIRDIMGTDAGRQGPADHRGKPE
jgi:hypothetical protein